MPFKNRVQGGDSVTATTIVAPAADHATGDLIVVLSSYGAGGGSIASVADTIGNTYATAGAEFVSGTGNNFNIHWAKSVGTHASNIVTVTLASTTTYRAIVVYAITGQDLSAPVNTTARADGNSTTLSSGTLTLVAPTEIICAIGVRAPVLTGGAGYTYVNFGLTADPVAYYIDEYHIVTASEAATATTTASGFWGILAASFKMAVAVPAEAFPRSRRPFPFRPGSKRQR